MTISLLLRGPQGRGIFDDIPEEKLPKDMLDLAKHIVDSKKAEWKPERFEDQYEDALKELLKRKQSGQKIEAPRDREPSKVVNLMDALRRSVETERAGGERRKPAPRAGNHRAPKKAGRSSARAKKSELARLGGYGFNRMPHRPRPAAHFTPRLAGHLQNAESRN